MNKEYEYYTHAHTEGKILYRFTQDKNELGYYWVSNAFDGGTRLPKNTWNGPKTSYMGGSGWKRLTVALARIMFPGAIPDTTDRQYKAITLLQNAGFQMINNNNSDWTYNGLRICINPNQKITLQEFVNRVADQAAFNTRQQMILQGVTSPYNYCCPVAQLAEQALYKG